jgi:hypothetical protein
MMGPHFEYTMAEKRSWNMYESITRPNDALLGTTEILYKGLVCIFSSKMTPKGLSIFLYKLKIVDNQNLFLLI